jgi:hypothetical protein
MIASFLSQGNEQWGTKEALNNGTQLLDKETILDYKPLAKVVAL